MERDYTKIYSGNFMISSRIVGALEQIGIIPIVKDEAESARLAGFPSPMQENQEIYVQNAETEKAKTIIDRILAEIKS